MNDRRAIFGCRMLLVKACAATLVCVGGFALWIRVYPDAAVALFHRASDRWQDSRSRVVGVIAPPVALRGELDRYNSRGYFEPIDEDEKCVFIHELVKVIRRKRTYRASGELLDVWLYYDATDNHARGEARDTLVSFGRRVLPAVRARIRGEKRCGSPWTVEHLEELEHDILGRGSGGR